MSATTARLYVGTYAKYNNGSIEGKWLDLSDFSDAGEFMEACRELHSDEADPEFMFQDYEGFPADMYGEAMSEDEIQKIYDALEVLEKLEDLSDNDWVNLHNQYCQNEGNADDEIYTFDEDFFETFFADKPMEAARATAFGEVNWSDEWIKFNGYANLESVNGFNLSNHIDKDEIRRDIIENPENYSL